jgi:adenylate cyclase
VMARLVAARLPFFRSTLHMSTLHPQLLGFTANWRADLGVCDEVQVRNHIRETDDYLQSPLRPIFEEGREVRLDPRDPADAARYPLMVSLAAAGGTDYWAFPVKRSEDRYNIMTVATQCPGGFPVAAVAGLKALLPALALNVDIVSRKRIAENILDAYLGRRSGRRVLAGEIQRGSGETIDAIVWVADMRDFTGLSDRLDGPDMVRLLNSYFGRLVDAVHAERGEVLKFIGDGLLAIFPISEHRSAGEAAAAALGAARAALAAIDRLAATVAGESGQVLDMGIALHRGPVYFGNIGAADRVDFTVIGPAVNLAARVEPLTKQVKRRLLLTREVADLLDAPFEDMGDFALRGVALPERIFAAAGRRS